MSQPIRTRFAPSPTGNLHIGNARTAIMNWIYTRHCGGQFILRIEDTDEERSTKESETKILNDLKWLGLDWDEGPDVGGETGPYRQSERKSIYDESIQKLRIENKIYPCYCTPDELEERRKEALEKGQSSIYDGRCRNLTAEQIQQYENEGRSSVLRFKVTGETLSYIDLVKGEMSINLSEIGDFVLVRPDGMPMYNFACVIDDGLMKISHVIRGDDHVINTYRQILLYQALGWEIPAFAHIPMILGPDRTRLSKRHGATSVAQYEEEGFLPEALINFLSLLAWSSESGEEILSLEQIVEEFDFKRVSKSAAVFDPQKLSWMNGIYIRNATPESLVPTAKKYLERAGYPQQNDEALLGIVKAVHDKFERFSELSEKAAIFFHETVQFETEEARTMIQTEESQKVFNAFLQLTEELKEWDGSVFMQTMKQIQKETGVKGKLLWMPVRIALTGQEHGPEIPRIIEVFGLEKCRQRIAEVLNC